MIERIYKTLGTYQIKVLYFPPSLVGYKYALPESVLNPLPLFKKNEKGGILFILLFLINHKGKCSVLEKAL